MHVYITYGIMYFRIRHYLENNLESPATVILPQKGIFDSICCLTLLKYPPTLPPLSLVVVLLAVICAGSNLCRLSNPISSGQSQFSNLCFELTLPAVGMQNVLIF